MGKLKLLIIFVLLISSLFLTGVSFAEDQPAVSVLDKAGDKAGYNVQEAEDPLGFSKIVGRVINVFLSVLGMIFIGIIIYAGYLWMTAKGNAEEVEKSKMLMMNASIGLIIVVGAYAITYFILNVFVSGYMTDESVSLYNKIYV